MDLSRLMRLYDSWTPERFGGDDTMITTLLRSNDLHEMTDQACSFAASHNIALCNAADLYRKWTVGFSQSAPSLSSGLHYACSNPSCAMHFEPGGDF